MSPVERVSAVSVLADISGRPVIDHDIVFATSHAGRSVAIELRRGVRNWDLNTGGTSDPWIAGDTIFLVTKDAQILAATRDEGRVRWLQQLAHYRNEKEKAGPITWAGPVLAGGLLYVVSSEGQMLALSQQQVNFDLDRSVLDKMINLKLLLAEANDADRAKAKEIFDRQWSTFKKDRKLSDTEFDSMLDTDLKMKGITRADWEKQQQEQLTIVAVVQRLLNAPFTDEQAKKYYEDNVAKF